VVTTRDRRPILSGRFSAFQRVKSPYLGKILDTAGLILRASSRGYGVLAPGLKIRVSVVRFRPWPPSDQSVTPRSRSLAFRVAALWQRLPVASLHDDGVRVRLGRAYLDGPGLPLPASRPVCAVHTRAGVLTYIRFTPRYLHAPISSARPQRHKDSASFVVMLRSGGTRTSRPLRNAAREPISDWRQLPVMGRTC